MAIAFLQPIIQAFKDGIPAPGALLYFYQAGTSILITTYTDADQSADNTNPVEADGSGVFPPIFLPQGTVCDLALKDYLGAQIDRVDGYTIGPAAATQAEVDAGTGDGYVSASTLGGASSALINAILGYTPANVAGDTFSGPVRLGYVVTTGLTVDAAGFRGVPLTVRDADYTFVMDDAGRGARHTSASAHAWTIPPISSVVWPIGTTIYGRNYTTGGNITLTRGGGVVLRVAGSATDSNKTITANGEFSVTMEANDIWVARGVNIS